MSLKKKKYMILIRKKYCSFRFYLIIYIVGGQFNASGIKKTFYLNLF